MATLLLAKPVVDALQETIQSRIEVLADQGVTPTLGIVRVGARPDDLSYEKMLLKQAQAVGIAAQVFELAATSSTEDVLAEIEEVNNNPSIHGCLIFRPLPKAIDEKRVCDALAIEKDIDGISCAALGAVFMNSPEGFAPGTAQACLTTLDHYGVPLEGKHVVVVGRSLVVGRPVALLLLHRHATVSMCHSRTSDLAKLTQQADIVICATGLARKYDARYFRPGQVVLDVGINFDAEGTLCGDVDFDSVEPIVQALTPVPRGIGAVTTATMLDHVVTAAERAQAKTAQAKPIHSEAVCGKAAQAATAQASNPQTAERV